MRMIKWSVLVVALLLSSPAHAGPDLPGSVQVIVGNEPCYGDEAPVTFTLTLTNQGDEACQGEWWVDFWINWPCDCSVDPNECAQQPDAHWQASEFGELAPGESVTLPQVSLYMQPSPVPFTYLLYIDSMFGGSCDEDDEDNNIVCDFYETPPGCWPDLAVKSFTASAEVVEIAAEYVCAVEYTLTVENVGLGPTGQFDVDLFYDSLGPPSPGSPGAGTYLIAPGLQPGEAHEFQPIAREFGPVLPGGPKLIRHSWVVLDILDLAWEPDEGNNTADLYIKCSPPAPVEPAVETFPDVVSPDVVDLLAEEVVAPVEEVGEPAPEQPVADAPATADEGFAAGDNLPVTEGGGSDCGCRMDAPGSAGAAVWLLLLLAGLLGLLLHASTRKDHPTRRARG